MSREGMTTMPVGDRLKGMAGAHEEFLAEPRRHQLYCDRHSIFPKAAWHGDRRMSGHRE